jgi:hypothetical protein
MKMIAFLLFLGLCSLAAMILVILNRSSEKVVASYVTISVGALAGIGLAIFAFGDQTRIEERFPVLFFIDPATKKSIIITSRSSMEAEFDGVSKYAAAFDTPEDGWRQRAYHFALERAIVDWMMFIYWHTWRVESIQYDLPGPKISRTGPIEGSSEEATIVTLDSVQKLFSAGSPPKGFPQQNKIALPPGLWHRRATLTIREPFKAPAFGDTAEITIRNDFCAMSIMMRSEGGIRGLGEYAVLGGLSSDEANKYAQLHYEVLVRTKFTPWLAGHPDMPKHREWARTLVSMLRDWFDEQRILEHSRAQSRRVPLERRSRLPPIIELP